MELLSLILRYTEDIVKQETKKKLSLNVLFVSIILVVALPVFLLRLGWGSLEPWDEAWYAEISHNVTKGNILALKSHGRAFYDHPPLGFWIMALSFNIFGENEFTARLPMALAGIGSLIVIYFIGKELKNRWVGLMSLVILLTSRWFIFRARTGNLDALLILMQLLIFYFSYRHKKISDIYLAWLFLALALLIKSVISITLAPLVLFGTLFYFKRHNLQLKQLLILSLLFFTPLLIWYGYNFKLFGFNMLKRNIWEIGLREGAHGQLSLIKIKKILEMIQSLVHRWFKPFLTSIVLGLMFINTNSFRWIFAYLILTGFPYLISSKTIIWHIIPVIAPMALLIAIVINKILTIIIKKLKKFSINSNFLQGLGLITVIVLATITFYELLPELYRSTNQPSGQKILGSALKNYSGPLYLDSYKNLSTSVMYYANRQVIYINNDNIKKNLSNSKRPYSILTSDKNYLDLNCQMIMKHGDVYAIHCLNINNE